MKQTHIYAHERKKNTQQQIEINDSIEFWFFFLWLQTHKHNNHRWFRTKVQYTLTPLSLFIIIENKKKRRLIILFVVIERESQE